MERVYASLEKGIAEFRSAETRPEKPLTCRASSAFFALLFFGTCFYEDSTPLPCPFSSAPASFGNNGPRAAGGPRALHSVRSAGRRGHGQPLAMCLRPIVMCS